MGIYFVIMAIGAVVSAMIASGKGRSALGWGVVGALVPLISFIIILALEPVAEVSDRSSFTG